MIDGMDAFWIGSVIFVKLLLFFSLPLLYYKEDFYRNTYSTQLGNLLWRLYHELEGLIKHSFRARSFVPPYPTACIVMSSPKSLAVVMIPALLSQ